MKTALITGAASGLGRQLARDLFQRKWQLVLGDRQAEGLEDTVKVLGSPAQGVLTCTTDVTRPGDCRALVEKGLATFGGLDALVLCAGISMWARFDEVRDVGVFERLVAVNYLGAVYCVHAALPALRQNRGQLVAISSLQGEIALPSHTGYAAAKHALNGFLDGLEFEIGKEVRILTVMPGWITGTNLRRDAYLAQPADEPRRHSREAVSVEECSALVVRAMERGDRTLYIPAKLGLLKWIRLVSPRLVRYLIGRAVAQQRS